MYRFLIGTAAERFRPELARALVNLSVNLSELARHAEVLPAAQKAVDLYQDLAATDPQGYERRLAHALDNLSAANLAGPLVLGKLFDSVGRRKMITLTYCMSGLLLVGSANLLSPGVLTPAGQNAIFCVIFFFASAGASSAYLTVSEIFPLELRSQAISFFFAMSLLIGGVVAQQIFAHLVGDGTKAGPLIVGYYMAGLIMFAGGVIAWWFAVDAERKSLEEIANPLSAVRRVIEPPIEPS